MSFYISSTNAQSQPPKPCVVYESPTLVIVDLSCLDASNAVIAKYVAQGYDIKATTDVNIPLMYLTKQTP